MHLALEYQVRFQDFLLSLRAYRRRSVWIFFGYLFRIWILPFVGAAITLAFLYDRVAGDAALGSEWGLPVLVSAVLLMLLPLFYRLRILWAYRQRTSLSPDGRVRAELDETGIRFLIADKADVKYEWNAFSDFTEEKGVLSLFIQKASLNTIPSRDLTQSQWVETLDLISRKVRRR